MDYKTNRQSKMKHDDGRQGYPKPLEYEVVANEIFKEQKDVTKKKVRYKKEVLTEDPYFDRTVFQIPESDKNKYLQTHSENIGKSYKPNYVEGNSSLDHQERPKIMNINTGNTKRLEQDMIDAEVSQNDYSRKQKLVEQQKHHPAPAYEQEHVTNQIHYDQSMVNDNYKNYEIDNDKSSYENAGFDINKNASLICKAVNYDGKPVTVNNEVVRDKLILSCRPKRYYQAERPPIVDRSQVPQYVYPPPEVNVVDKVNIHRTTDVDYQRMDQESYLNKLKSPLAKTDAYDQGSLGVVEHITESEKEEIKYEEQCRVIQCKKYTKRFKNFLWGLFIINVLLLFIGIVLLLLTMYHLIFNGFMDTVIRHVGFVTWVWAALALSVLIISVGVYGIIAAISRDKRTLIFYCLLASFLAILIVIYLLIFWILLHSLRETQQKSMSKTFNTYRCNRLIRVAWDTLHEEYKCCGIEARGDWKYIPPSCCNAETKLQKLACINHFIKEDQAFKEGCRKTLEQYFTYLFILISILLLLALILLLLGILAALRLLKMFKVILLCREMYMITP